MTGIVIRPVVRVVVWLAVASLIALSVAQKRPRPNAGLREDDAVCDHLAGVPVDGFGGVPS
jgi:hypothetical protein